MPPVEFPSITIVTPSFNQGEYIEQTIDSILSQQYPNLQYIVMDGGSTDATPEILKKFSKHIHYWESVKDRGQSHAMISRAARPCVSGLSIMMQNREEAAACWSMSAS